MSEQVESAACEILHFCHPHLMEKLNE